MIEEQGAGMQLFQLHAWPHVPSLMIALIALLAPMALLAALDSAWGAALRRMGYRALADCAIAMKQWPDAIQVSTIAQR